MNIDPNKSPLSALVAEYNKLSGEKVKRFPDRKTAIRRLSSVMPKKVVELATSTTKMTKRERIVAFIRESHKSLDEICEAFDIKRNTVVTYLADISNPRYCGKALGSPVKVLRTEDGRVYVE